MIEHPSLSAFPMFSVTVDNDRRGVDPHDSTDGLGFAGDAGDFETQCR